MNCPLCQSANPADARRCRACGASLKAQSSENGAHLPDALPGGTLLIGTYAVEGVLGQGGFGITYRCHDQMLDRHVAIKEFFPSGCRRENAEVWPARGLSDTDYREARTQFLAEARTLARCHHAGIVSVYTAFEANKTAYMVMELLHGKTLAQLITARGGCMKEAEAVEIIERVGDALGFVHDLDLLHRDIKPDNIIVCDDGRVMLIDFGTAREFVKGQAQGQTVVVTPGYAPLEQYARQARRGAFTDIYSLAATLYHLLTGQMPPSASDRAMGVQLRPVREISPKVSASVAYATENGLQMEIAKRPQSVSEFLDLLHAPVQQVEAEALFPPQLIDLSFDEDADADANLLPPMLSPDAIRARQQAWQTAMPSANTQPVQIAPQSVFAPGVPPKSPLPPSAYNPANGRVQVKTSNVLGSSSALNWWQCVLVVGFAVLIFLNSLHVDRINMPYSSPNDSSSSSYSSPPVYNSPSSSNSQKKAAALRVWDALSIIAPASVEALPVSKNNVAFPVSNSLVGERIEFSPDGKRLAYVDGQSVLRVLSLPSRNVLRSIQLDKKYPPRDAMFSPDNETIAVAQTGKTSGSVKDEALSRVSVWSVRFGKKLGTFVSNSREKSVWPEAVENDGQILLRAASSSETLELFQWNPITGKTSKSGISSSNAKNWGYGVAAPDGKEFVIGDTLGHLRWFDFATGKIKHEQTTKLTQGGYKQRYGYIYNEISNEPLGVRGIDYSINGSYVASRNDGEIRVFDSKAKQLGVLPIDAKNSMLFSMSPDGQWLAARGSLPSSPEGTLLYNVKTKQIIRLDTPYDSMLDFGFSQDGKQLYGIFADGAKMQFVTWNVDPKAAKTPRLFASVDENWFNSVAQADNSTVAIAQAAQTIAITGANSIQIRRKNGGYDKSLATSDVAATLFSPDGKLLAVRQNNGGIQLWDVATNQLIRQLEGFNNPTPSTGAPAVEEKTARSMAFSADGSKLAYARTNGEADTIELWNIKDEQIRLASLKQKEMVNALTFSPDSKSLICGGEKGLLQWIDVATRKTKSQIQTGEPIFDIDFAARNLVVMGESNSVVYQVPATSSAEPLQNASKTKFPQTFNQSRDVYTPSAISPDGKLLATVQGYDAVQIWELPSGQLLQALPRQRNGSRIATSALSFSAGSTELTAIGASTGNWQMVITTYRRAKAE